MIDPRRLKKLFRQMVDIYSPSGKEEELLHFLRGYLRRRGLEPILQPVDESRYNLVVAPADGDIQLAFIGHLDTVSAYDLEHFGWSAEGDAISGLGVADMKGGCAALTEAFLALRQAHGSSLPLALCLVVGEEENGDGAAQLMKGFRFPWAVVGEPTDLRPAFASYGYLEFQLGAQGRRRHASLANPRTNATATLLRRLLALTRHLEHRHPDLIVNIRDLFSTRAGFAVPERCEAWLDVHLPPATSLGEIVTELEEIVNPGKRGGDDVEVFFRTATIDAGYALPVKGPLAEALQRVYRAHDHPWAPTPFPSHSDANQIWQAGTRPVILGPGELEKAHAADESVSLAQVVRAAAIYADLVGEYLSPPLPCLSAPASAAAPGPCP